MRPWLFGLLLLAPLPRAGEAAEGAHYVLSTPSTIVQVCGECTTPAGRPEPLRGSFSLTSLPLSQAGGHVAALTDLDWQSRSYRVRGAGFIETLPSGHLNIVVQARVNGEDMQLRATRRQPRGEEKFTVLLGTPRGGQVQYLMLLTAVPEDESAPDGDGDGVADDSDNCPAVANLAQYDGDGDGVGDSCDACAETPAEAPVNRLGCGVEQTCPCDETPDQRPWRKKEYGRCVAGAVRELRREDVLSRRDAIKLLRRALSSGCGQIVLALR